MMGVVSVIPVLILTLAVLQTRPIYPLLLAITALIATFTSSTFGVLLSFLVKDPAQVMVVFNLVRFPMMFLSDVVIPAVAMPNYLLPIVLIQPLTYLTEAMRFSYMGTYDTSSPGISVTISMALGIIFLILASNVIKRSKP